MYKNFKNIRRYQIAAIISGIVSVFSVMFTTVLLQRVIDEFIENNFMSVKNNLTLFAISLSVNVIATFVFQYFYRLIDYTGSFSLRRLLFGCIIKSDYLDLHKLKRGDFSAIVTDDSEKISKVYSCGILNMSIEFVQFLMTITIIAYYNFLIAAILLGIVICGIIVINLFTGKVGELSIELQKESAKEQSRIIESVECIRTIKMLEKEAYIEKEYSEILMHKQAIAKRIAKYYALYADVFTFISNILPLCTLIISALFLLNGSMTLGGAIAILNIAGALTEPISLIGGYISDWKISKSLVEKDKDFLNDKVIACGKEIDFENLSFQSDKYSFDEKNILENVHFSISKGDIFVIKGRSGTGKSTIFNLLTKCVPKRDVNISINHQNLSEISLEDINASIKLAEQDTMIFNKSLHENLCLGDYFSTNEIQEAVDAAQLSSFVKDKGYDFIIEENGNNISGGELQRIGICRMLLRRPKMLLLDEPTSALDEKTAENLVQSLKRFANKYEMTLMIITHRPDFEKIADKVITVRG